MDRHRPIAIAIPWESWPDASYRGHFVRSLLLRLLNRLERLLNWTSTSRRA
ncbi:MAG TPA: hypothetical protein PKJ19_03795 [Flavobacteriales bacterium]|nr:hypothetical protein [Flavobacteriales bacterium]HNU57881.1 hypothetical protein [Flavobacteriales bacterium]